MRRETPELEAGALDSWRVAARNKSTVDHFVKHCNLNFLFWAVGFNGWTKWPGPASGAWMTFTADAKEAMGSQDPEAYWFFWLSASAGQRAMFYADMTHDQMDRLRLFVGHITNAARDRRETVLTVVSEMVETRLYTLLDRCKDGASGASSERAVGMYAIVDLAPISWIQTEHQSL